MAGHPFFFGLRPHAIGRIRPLATVGPRPEDAPSYLSGAAHPLAAESRSAGGRAEAQIIRGSYPSSASMRL